MEYKNKLVDASSKLNNPQLLAIIYLIPFGYLIVENPLWLENIYIAAPIFLSSMEGANKRGNSSRLTQSFHFFMFEPIFSPVNALNQPI